MKKNYQQPVSSVLELSVESMLAASGANKPGGGGQDMPWGSNGKNSSINWDNYMN